MDLTKTKINFLYNIKILVFITEVGNVYCAVRTESSDHTDVFRLYKDQVHFIYMDSCIVNVI